LTRGIRELKGSKRKTDELLERMMRMIAIFNAAWFKNPDLLEMLHDRSFLIGGSRNRKRELLPPPTVH
jgi:hypothetical protein